MLVSFQHVGDARGENTCRSSKLDAVWLFACVYSNDTQLLCIFFSGAWRDNIIFLILNSFKRGADSHYMNLNV